MASAEAPDVDSVPVEADGIESDDVEAAPMPTPPGRIRPRRTVFERLSQAHRCPWKVGDRVLVRDRDEREHGADTSRPSEDDWNPGIVTSLHPVKVRLKGGKEAFTWREIKELPSRSPSQSPSSTWSNKCLPASAEVLRRARKLSRRRRKREKEAERKDIELWAITQRIQSAKLRRNASKLPSAAEQKKQEKVRKLRLALEEVLPGLDDVQPQPPQAKPQASPGRAKATQPLGPSISALKVLKLSKDLPAFGFHLEDLELLTVKDKKGLLAKLSHPRPELAVQEDAFSAWIRQQLQHFRMYCSSGQLPQAASSSTTAMSILHLLRDCIKRAAPTEDDNQSLQRFDRALKDAHLEFDHLARLPQAEVKHLVEKLGIKMTGMKKEEVIQKLKKDLWSQRTKASLAVSDADLCRYQPAQVIATVRRLLKKAEEERGSKRMTVWQLHRWLGQYDAQVKDLSCLLPAELRQLTSWLKMPPLRSKDDILEWLQREVWREQMERGPKGSRFYTKAGPEVHEATEEDEESEDGMFLVDLNSEFTMEYDMFVPT